jgi:hypothetical protein
VRAALLVAAACLVACTGEVLDPPDGGAGQTDAGAVADAGHVLPLNTFTLRATGWPSGKRVVGAALLDNVLYAACDAGVFALPLTDTGWQAVTVPLGAGEAPTSLQRLDNALLLTSASTTKGGLYSRPWDGAWARVTSSPQAASWQVVKKGAELLLATTGGLFAATGLTSPWVRRSAAGTATFAHAATTLVAASAQQRLFAAGDPGWQQGELATSNDLGATWTTGLAKGDVRALGAAGAYVYVEVSTDGTLRSDNYGGTFKPMPAPVGTSVKAFLIVDARVYAGTAGGVRTSDDNGATWADDAHGLPVGTGVNGLFLAGSLLLADTAAGPYLVQLQ